VPIVRLSRAIAQILRVPRGEVPAPAY